MNTDDKPPTFRHELWGITRIMLCVVGGGVALIGTVFLLADVEHHPIRAVVVLYTIVLALMIFGGAWWGYRSKRRSWEERQKFQAEMEAIRKGEK